MSLLAAQAAPEPRPEPSSGVPRSEAPQGQGDGAPLAGDPRLSFVLAVGAAVVLLWVLMRIGKAFGMK